MDILYELIRDNTMPSHRFEIGLKLQLYGVALTIDRLVFSGLHAKRILLVQHDTEALVLVRMQGELLVAVVAVHHWQHAVTFRIIGCHVVRWLEPLRF